MAETLLDLPVDDPNESTEDSNKSDIFFRGLYNENIDWSAKRIAGIDATKKIIIATK